MLTRCQTILFAQAALLVFAGSTAFGLGALDDPRVHGLRSALLVLCCGLLAGRSRRPLALLGVDVSILVSVLLGLNYARLGAKWWMQSDPALTSLALATEMCVICLGSATALVFQRRGLGLSPLLTIPARLAAPSRRIAVMGGLAMLVAGFGLSTSVRQPVTTLASLARTAALDSDHRALIGEALRHPENVKELMRDPRAKSMVKTLRETHGDEPVDRLASIARRLVDGRADHHVDEDLDAEIADLLHRLNLPPDLDVRELLAKYGHLDPSDPRVQEKLRELHVTHAERMAVRRALDAVPAERTEAAPTTSVVPPPPRAPRPISTSIRSNRVSNRASADRVSTVVTGPPRRSQSSRATTPRRIRRLESRAQAMRWDNGGSPPVVDAPETYEAPAAARAEAEA
ncbi:MAG: hypothetical protein ACYTGP_13185, partial [Planctomycetota bacterium]